MTIQIKGYLSVPETFSVIFDAIARKPENADTTFDDLHERTLHGFYEFCLNRESANALSPSGELFEVGPWFLSNFSPDGRNHAMFAFDTGLIRSMRFDEADKAGWFRQSDETRLGSLLRLLDRSIPFVFLTLGVWAATALFLAAFTSWGLILDIKPAGPDGTVSALVDEFLLNFALSSFGGSIGVALVVAAIRQLMANRAGGSPYLIGSLGGFEGCSVVFPAGDVSAFAEAIANPTASNEERTMSEASIAQRIVASVDNGEVFTRKEAKIKFAPDVSFRAFERAWSRARQQRPAIGKSGRKPSNS